MSMQLQAGQCESALRTALRNGINKFKIFGKFAVAMFSVVFTWKQRNYVSTIKRRYPLYIYRVVRTADSAVPQKQLISFEITTI